MGMEITVGSRVSARGLAWDVTEITPLGAQTMLRLRCTAGDMIGFDWDILHPTEPVELLRAELRPEAPSSLAAWRLHHQACLLEQVLGPADMVVIEPGRVRIEPYQLVPLMRALELPRPRLLLADGVGLGKTIEAGLIVCELIARRRAHRVLIVTPAGPLLVQWAQELRQRFGLRFVLVTEAAALQEQRRKLELGGNPFDAIALCLTSLDFAKQERVLEELERSAWDLAIIDEAHHCVSASASTDRDDTQRRRLAEVVARRSDGLLLLTATPHDGYDPHFASLIELLDPSLVDGRGGMAGSTYRRHVVRRLKSHIRNATTGAPLFRERKVIPVRVDLDGVAASPVRQFHQALAALIAPRLRRGARTSDHMDALAFVSLLKRSVSTIGACVNTLRVVAERYGQASTNAAETAALQKERARALRAYRKRVLRFGVLDADAEGDIADLEADGMAADLHNFAATEMSVSDHPRRRRRDATAEALDMLIRLGEAATTLDPKLAAMVGEVRAIRAAYPATNILIYTEYSDSQAAALQALRNAPGIDGEVLAINGLDAERERTRIAERCAEQDGIILVSTDSLAEGLNLQQRCCNLIHLDLPYNPNRLEQRNGRIDRYGQEREPQIRYLYLAGTFEERLLLRLIAKYETARAQLTFMPDTLAVTADEAALGGGLIAGFAERQAMLFADEPPAVRTLDQVAQEENSDAYRDLLHEIDRAFKGFDRSAVRHGWMVDQGLNADAVQVAAANATSTAKQRIGRARGSTGFCCGGDLGRDRSRLRQRQIVAGTSRMVRRPCRSAGFRCCRRNAALHAKSQQAAGQAGAFAGVSWASPSRGATRHFVRAVGRRIVVRQPGECVASGCWCIARSAAGIQHGAAQFDARRASASHRGSAAHARFSDRIGLAGTMAPSGRCGSCRDDIRRMGPIVRDVGADAAPGSRGYRDGGHATGNRLDHHRTPATDGAGSKRSAALVLWQGERYCRCFHATHGRSVWRDCAWTGLAIACGTS